MLIQIYFLIRYEASLIFKGISWTIINKGPNSSINLNVTALPVQDIAVDPRGTDTLWISAYNDMYYEFVKSENAYASYKTISLNDTTNNPVSSIAINANSPDTIYLAKGNHVLLFDAINEYDTLILSGFPGEEIPDVSHGSILVGTTTGFFVIDIEHFDDIVTINNIININDKITLYPNPTFNSIMIEWQNLAPNQSITIKLFDIIGKEVLSKEVTLSSNQFKLDINGIPSGIYTIELKNKSEKITARIIIR